MPWAVIQIIPGLSLRNLSKPLETSRILTSKELRAIINTTIQVVFDLLEISENKFELLKLTFCRVSQFFFSTWFGKVLFSLGKFIILAKERIVWPQIYKLSIQERL